MRLLACLFLSVSFSAAEARSWRDLDEGEHEIYGREREEKLPIRMFFVQHEKWDNHDSLHILWLYGSTDYPRYQSNRLLPFYYSLSSKIDNRSLFLSLPYYSEIDGKEEDRALFWLYYWGKNDASGSRYSLLFPLYYHKADDAGSRFLISPVLFYSRSQPEQTSAESNVALGIPVLPLVLWRSGEQKRDLTLFYVFRHRSLADSTLSYTLPLYYYDAAKDGSSGFFLSLLYMNDHAPQRHDSAILWLFYRGDNERTGKRYSALFPLYYYATRGEEETNFVTPLFIYQRNNNAQSKSLFFLSPLYASDSTDKQADTSALWLYYWGENTEQGSRYSGLFPFYYRSSHEDGRRILVTPLFWYSRDADTAGVAKPAFLLTPVYMHNVGAQSSHSALLWLYYWGESCEPQKNYHLLFPLFYNSSAGDSERFLLTPLFWYWHKEPQGDIQRSETSLGIPALPVFYWYSGADGKEFNFIYLVRHRRRGAQLTTYALPFYYYSRDGDETFASYLMPFIWTTSKGEKSTWLILPFFYSAETGNSAIKLSPLYIALTGENSNFRLFLPLYLNYNTKDYSFHLNLTGISLSEEKLTNFPLSAEISREKILVDWDLGWFYNLFRVSSRDTLRLQEPARPVAIPAVAEQPPVPKGKKAAPKTAKKGKTAKDTGSAVNPPVAEAANNDKARITHKRERTRADSENFFGLYFLFGASAYERADHYRHFRLLPLSWLTWNANNSQGVQTVIPFYVKYEDDDSQYLVFFPVYGTQRRFFRKPGVAAVNAPLAPPECTGEITSWLIIGYWNEYDCDTKISEQTVLWPIFNRYASDRVGGFRIFPVFWSKWHREGDREKALHFSPLHYTTIDGENFSTTSWLFYRRRTESDSSWGVWGLMHFDRNHDDRAATRYILPVYYHRSDRETGKGKPGEQVRLRRESLLTAALLFWRYYGGNNDEYFTAQLSPIYLYFGERDRGYFYSWLYYHTDSPRGTSFGVPLLLHRRTLTSGNYSNFYLVPFYHSREKFAENNTEYLTWVFPLFYHRTSATSNAFVMPLFYRYARRSWLTSEKDSAAAGSASGLSSEEVGHISPLYYYHARGGSADFYSWLFYRFSSEQSTAWGIPLLLHRRSFQDGSYGNFFLLAFYRSVQTRAAGDDSVTWLFPLFYARNSPDESALYLPLFYRSRYPVATRVSQNTATGAQSSENVYEVRHLSPLYTYRANDNQSAFYSWLFYRTASDEKTSFGVPLLFHRKYYTNDGYSNVYLIPFYYSRERLSPEYGEEYVTLLFPLWYRRSDDKSHSRFVLGYWHESSAGYRKDLLPLVAGRTDDQNADIYSWHALLYTFWYERAGRSRDFRLLYGVGFNYTDKEDIFSWHFALISGYKTYLKTGHIRHYALPFYWHTHAGDDSELYLPFLAARFSSRDGGNDVFRAILFGLLYYQNSDYRAHDQTLGVLLGSLYYHNKYPERKFDSYGSLYGLLWHYETEENYKRFSLLTFIYTRTETEKGTRHRLLGIPL